MRHAEMGISLLRVNMVEKKVIDPDSAYRGQYIQELLPKLGADGWEMVNVVPYGGDLVTMFFKRPLEEPSV